MRSPPALKPIMSPLTLSVVGAKPGTRVEVVPGKTYVSLPADAVETVGIATMVPAGDGTFRPMVKIGSRWVKISPDNLRRCHIAIPVQGLKRLIRAGFVIGGPITPGVWQFDLFSYLAHERAVMTNPEEFWSTKEPGQLLSNHQRFHAAL